MTPTPNPALLRGKLENLLGDSTTVTNLTLTGSVLVFTLLILPGKRLETPVHLEIMGMDSDGGVQCRMHQESLYGQRAAKRQETKQHV